MPSLRLGYLVAPPDLLDSFAAARAVSQGHAPLLDQMTLAEMMHRGLYAAHLRRMRTLYRGRQTALAEGLFEALGHVPAPVELRSGMHLVLPFRDGVDDVAAAGRLADDGVVARPLSPYSVGTPARRGLILGFAAFPEHRIRDACGRLARLRPFLETH